MRPRLACPAAAGLVVVCSVALSAVLTTLDGAFTAEQAERGRIVYDEHCVACHPVEFYEAKLLVWQNAYVVELFDALSGTMPSENPGGLSQAQYLDVLAYVFQITGSPPGEDELTLETIDAIEIVVADPAAQ